MLSKCMSRPPMLGFNAGLHCLHYLWAHKEDGIEFNSEGNHEPIGFYEQKTLLCIFSYITCIYDNILKI